jgi:hypothetical protein
VAIILREVFIVKKKLAVTYLVKEFPVFYATISFISMVETFHDWRLHWAN